MDYKMCIPFRNPDITVKLTLAPNIKPSTLYD